MGVESTVDNSIFASRSRSRLAGSDQDAIFQGRTRRQGPVQLSMRAALILFLACQAALTFLRLHPHAILVDVLFSLTENGAGVRGIKFRLG